MKIYNLGDQSFETDFIESLLYFFANSISSREWFSYHFPELIKIVSDNYMYAKVAKYIKSRKELTEDRLPGLEEIVMDEAKAKGIYDASKMSMGKLFY